MKITETIKPALVPPGNSGVLEIINNDYSIINYDSAIFIVDRSPPK